MMKKMLMALTAALLLILTFCSTASAGEYAAHTAMAWLDEFASSLSAHRPLNDPAQTADPARAGEYLIEYDFGTVLANAQRVTSGDQILSVELRSDAAADCRGVRVGMGIDAALGGAVVGPSDTQLYVFRIQESGCGFAWAYVGDTGVYGVEYVTYGGEGLHTEYTLTYVIDRGVISAIRMRMAASTQAQAQEALATAEEIASRQHGEVLALANTARMFDSTDLTVMGGDVLGRDVASLIARIGEPAQVQDLQRGSGRMLVYDGVLVHVNLDEMTGMEVVRSVSVSSERVTGPRGLSVGFAVQEAAALFRCDGDVSSLGGALYLEGEALGEPPCGELIAGGAGDMILRYSCLTDEGKTASLEAVAREGTIAVWTLALEDGTEGI